MFTKYILVVDDDVDVRITSEVLFRLSANTDSQRDGIFTKDPSDLLGHSTSVEGEATNMCPRPVVSGNTQFHHTSVEMIRLLKCLPP